jgi:signal transduction histidine kinase
MTTTAAPTVQPAPTGTPGPNRSRGTLTGRAVAITCLVALISVVITAAVALPLTIRSGNQDARRVLADKARVAAKAIEGRNTALAQQREDQRADLIAQTLRDQGTDVVLIRDSRADSSDLPDRITRQVINGQSVSQVIVYKGRTMLAEGRPTGAGNGIVLLQAASVVSVRSVLGRLGLALLAGLAAGLLAGVVLARRLGRPLRDVASAARRLSGGDRTARAPTEAPSEVADVSIALNDLAAALATSENRQRAFLTSVSHELRTPLTTIKGYAEALADGVIGPDGAQRAGQTMLAESAHLDRLVEDLLVLARLEADDFPLEIAPVELVALSGTAAASWSRRYDEVGIELRTELPGQTVLVRSDAGRVRQIVDGLLENALRVVPPGAPVVLAVHWAPASSYAVIEVRDGGPGFTDEDLAVAFERGALHERYKAVRKVGSGIGLALAARLVSRLGGSIEAGHAPEGGARISVRLPTQDGAVAGPG